MRAHRAEFPIAAMCRMLDVSSSGYYAWLKREPSERAQANAELLQQIREVHADFGGTYGAPRVHAALNAAGVQAGYNRVARLMRKAGLRGVCRRKRVSTTKRAETGADQQPTRNDLVQREFSADGPDQLWVADATYIPTRTGWLYLAVVLDVWSRRIVGWSMSSRQTTDLMVTALEMAIGQRKPDGVIHHSDHGSQYTSIEFGKRCREAGIRPSFGSVGDCYDNAMCESFFATLEYEYIDRHAFDNPDHARMGTFWFIEAWYNTRRLHSAIGYMSPAAFEDAHHAQQRATSPQVSTVTG